MFFSQLFQEEKLTYMESLQRDKYFNHLFLIIVMSLQITKTQNSVFQKTRKLQSNSILKFLVSHMN